MQRSCDVPKELTYLFTIGDLPKGIDVAVLIVPQVAIMDSVRACIEREIAEIT